ncbi:hypothetical protein [Rufibacter ruber]|uniref:hypothetical protein n=1 Tax=Rufibacter ruber TaxID=1783499 RepID=UPI0008367314|nr:hypothetical protein [Rufibacter ruber]
MKKSITLFLSLVASFTALCQDFPVEGKKNHIVYRGNKRDTVKIDYDLKPKVKEWLKENKEKAHGFTFHPESNTYTGTFHTVLKYVDAQGVEQRYPLYFTMNLAVVESSVLKESTYRYELKDFQVLGKKRKAFPAEQLLINGENDKKDQIPAEKLHEIQLQATTFIDNLLESLHKKMLARAIAQN